MHTCLRVLVFVRVSSLSVMLLLAQALRDLLEYNRTIVIPGLVEFLEEHSFFPFDNYNLPLSRHLIQGPPNSLYQVVSSTISAVACIEPSALHPFFFFHPSALLRLSP